MMGILFMATLDGPARVFSIPNVCMWDTYEFIEAMMFEDPTLTHLSLNSEESCSRSNFEIYLLKEVLRA